MKNGLILLNLGTPDSTKVKDVRKYLRQFLSDPRVLDIPWLLRTMLLNLVILPTRPKKSAAAYKRIWQENGSPLLINTINLADKASKLLGENWHVEVAMRYANPSIKDIIAKMHAKRVEKIFVLPLFPQYASSSYGSAVASLYQELTKYDYVMPVYVKEPYYDDKEFVNIISKDIQKKLAPDDFLLMSFHGLPERHVIRSDGGKLPKGCDLKSHCPKITAANLTCYRAQCYATAKAVAKKLNMQNYEVAFQSRLGKTPWIQPYTDEFLEEILNRGFKSLIVACPSFTSDCLETIEEIGMELKEQWLDMGGEKFQLVSCLNDNNDWAELICKWAKSYSSKT